MVAAVAVAPAPTRAPLPGLDTPTMGHAAHTIPSRLQARPIPVAAYPAGVPRWVTYDGRRSRVVAVNQQPVALLLPPGLSGGARRLEVELADGRSLTLVHSGTGWSRE